MDIIAEKLFLIEQLARVQDVEVIRQIKEILKNRTEPFAGYEPGGGSINEPDLRARAEASNQAIKEGRITSIGDLEKDSEGW